MITQAWDDCLVDTEKAKELLGAISSPGYNSRSWYQKLNIIKSLSRAVYGGIPWHTSYNDEIEELAEKFLSADLKDPSSFLRQLFFSNKNNPGLANLLIESFAEATSKSKKGYLAWLREA